MKKKMNRRTVQFFSSYPSLYDVNQETGKLYRIIITIFINFAGAIQILVFSLQNMYTIYNFIFSFSNFLITIIFSSNTCAFLYTNKKVRQLMRYIDQHIYTYSDESKITPSYDWIEQDENMVRVFFYICGYHTFLTIGLALSPCMQLLINGKTEVMIYPAWIPWPVDRPVPFLCAYVINFVGVTVGCLTFNLCCIFPLFITLEFRRQRKRLCAALISIEKRAEERAPLNMKAKPSCAYAARRLQLAYRRILKTNVIECIKHHQMLLRAFKLFQSWWKIVFSVQLAVSMVNVALSVFAFMQMDDPIRIANTMPIVYSCVIGLLLNCHIGEEFSMINEEVNKSIFYETKWYARDTDIKRLLIIFHMLVGRRPFPLYGLYIFEASHATFAYICRKSYSSLNILLASTK